MLRVEAPIGPKQKLVKIPFQTVPVVLATSWKALLNRTREIRTAMHLSLPLGVDEARFPATKPLIQTDSELLPGNTGQIFTCTHHLF